MRSKIILFSSLFFLSVIFSPDLGAASFDSACDQLQKSGYTCELVQNHSVYNYGVYDPYRMGMGKTRGDAAYCLMRDGAGAEGNVLEGNDWKKFGVKSGLNVIYAGKQPSNVYRVTAQRVLEIVLFGQSIRTEVQNFNARFLTEQESALREYCFDEGTDWIGIQNLRCPLYHRMAGYLDLEVESVSLNYKVDAEGFKVGLTQSLPFLYLGDTKLAAEAVNFSDGMIIEDAHFNNLWELGINPNANKDQTSLVKMESPLIHTPHFDFKLGVQVAAKGEYFLDEISDVENTQRDPLKLPSSRPIPNSAMGATRTHLSSAVDIHVGMQVCVGLDGKTVCEDFMIFNAQGKNTEQMPLNWISYSAGGEPMKAKFKQEAVMTDPEQIKAQVATCLAAAPLENDSQSSASPEDWMNFAKAIPQIVSVHFNVCQKSSSAFKLCDDQGKVYAPAQ